MSTSALGYNLTVVNAASTRYSSRLRAHKTSPTYEKKEHKQQRKKNVMLLHSPLPAAVFPELRAVCANRRLRKTQPLIVCCARECSQAWHFPVLFVSCKLIKCLVPTRSAVRRFDSRIKRTNTIYENEHLKHEGVGAMRKGSKRGIYIKLSSTSYILYIIRKKTDLWPNRASSGTQWEPLVVRKEKKLLEIIA